MLSRPGHTNGSSRNVIMFAYGEQCSELNDILGSLISIYLVNKPHEGGGEQPRAIMGAARYL